MKSRTPAAEPCLWLPGHPVPHLLDPRRPPRLRVHHQGRKAKPAVARLDRDQHVVPATDRPTAQAPGERVGAYENGPVARGYDEVHAFAAVALCGW
jgi:hypothetical protein